MTQPHMGRTPIPNVAWHALLAELPPHAEPLRRSVAPPEILERPEGKAIAGWDQLVVELSAGDAGLRMILVVVDADDIVVSASDAILQRIERNDQTTRDSKNDGRNREARGVEYCHESLGGRFEHDGKFHGTRWRVVTAEEGDDGEAAPLDSSSSEPTDDDLTALQALVREVVRRAPPRVS